MDTKTLKAIMISIDRMEISDKDKNEAFSRLSAVYRMPQEEPMVPQTFSCCVCMFEGPDHVINRDDTLMVISGMLVCLEHAPYVPGHLILSQMIANSNRDTELARQALEKMK